MQNLCRQRIDRGFLDGLGVGRTRLEISIRIFKRGLRLPQLILGLAGRSASALDMRRKQRLPLSLLLRTAPGDDSQLSCRFSGLDILCEQLGAAAS